MILGLPSLDGVGFGGSGCGAGGPGGGPGRDPGGGGGSASSAAARASRNNEQNSPRISSIDTSNDLLTTVTALLYSAKFRGGAENR